MNKIWIFWSFLTLQSGGCYHQAHHTDKPQVNIRQLTQVEWILVEEQIEDPNGQRLRPMDACLSKDSVQDTRYDYIFLPDGRFEIKEIFISPIPHPPPRLICNGWWTIERNHLCLMFAEGDRVESDIKEMYDNKLILERNFEDENGDLRHLRQIFKKR
jgi:hypothetical protein